MNLILGLPLLAKNVQQLHFEDITRPFKHDGCWPSLPCSVIGQLGRGSKRGRRVTRVALVALSVVKSQHLAIHNP